MKNKALWIVTLLLACVCFIIFKDYLTFKKAYFFFDISSDGFYSTYPFLYNATDYFDHHQIAAWSFRAGMGQNIFPFLLRDPFDIILFVSGKDHILYLIPYIEVLKIMLTGIFFFKYLKLLKFSDGIAFIGTLLLAFCGFITETSPWFAFTFEAFNFVLLLYGFELYMAKGRWFVFSFAIFLFCISMPFNLFLYGVFLFFYIIFRHLQEGRFNFPQLSKLYLKLVGVSMVGVLLAGPFLLQNIWLLLHNPRGGDPNFIRNNIAEFPPFKLGHHFQLGTSIMRFFSNDILGSGDHYKGYESVFSAGEFYCGLICLLLVPQIFLFLSKREKIIYSIYLLIWVIPILFPFFRSALWMFTGPYFRSYSMLVAFVFILYTLYVLQRISTGLKVNIPVLLITLALIAIFLYSLVFHYIMDNSRVDKMIQTFVAIMILSYSILLVLFSRLKNPPYLKYIFFILVLFEVSFSGWMTANRRESFAFKWLRDEKVMYNDNFKQAASAINQSDRSFFRIDRNFDPSSTRWTALGANQAENYYSTSNYNPFNELYYIRFLELMGVVKKNVEVESRWAIGLGNSPILEIENSVKYYLGQDHARPAWPELWDSLAILGDVTIYRNKYTLPFGFTYDHYISENDFARSSPQQQKYITTKAVIVADGDVEQVSELTAFRLKDTTAGQFTVEELQKNVDSLKTDTLSLAKFSDDEIVGDITLSKSKLVYLSVPFDDGWRCLVDFSEYKPIIINGGLMGIFLEKGRHHVELFYRLRFMKKGAMMTLLALIIMIYFAQKKISIQIKITRKQ